MRSKKLIALAGMLLILGASLVFAQSRETNQVQSKQEVQEKVRQLEIKEIKRALREANGVKSRAAKLLGITERMVSYKMKIYDITEFRKNL